MLISGEDFNISIKSIAPLSSICFLVITVLLIPDFENLELFEICPLISKHGNHLARLAEKNNQFDEKFIKLARNVYKFNDERAKIKLAINNALGSNIKEVKSYE